MNDMGLVLLQLTKIFNEAKPKVNDTHVNSGIPPILTVIYYFPQFWSVGSDLEGGDRKIPV